MNYPAAELRSIEMDFSPINPDAEHRGILLIKTHSPETAEGDVKEILDTVQGMMNTIPGHIDEDL